MGVGQGVSAARMAAQVAHEAALASASLPPSSSAFDPSGEETAFDPSAVIVSVVVTVDKTDTEKVVVGKRKKIVSCSFV